MMTLRVTRAVTAIAVLNMTSCKPGKSSIKKLTGKLQSAIHFFINWDWRVITATI